MPAHLSTVNYEKITTFTKNGLFIKPHKFSNRKARFCNVMCPTKYHSTKGIGQELAEQNTLCRIDKKETSKE